MPYLFEAITTTTITTTTATTSKKKCVKLLRGELRAQSKAKHENFQQQRERKKTDIKIKYRQKDQSYRSIEFVYDMYIQFNCVIYVVIISLG